LGLPEKQKSDCLVGFLFVKLSKNVL